MKKILIIACLYTFTLSLGYAQVNHKIITPVKKKMIVTEQRPVVSSKSKPAEESTYYGYDHKISNISITNSIPVGFPTRENYPTKESYRNEINKWIKNNSSSIKPEFKGTEITDK